MIGSHKKFFWGARMQKRVLFAAMVCGFMVAPIQAKASCTAPIGAVYTTAINAYLFSVATQINLALAGLATDVQEAIHLAMKTQVNAAKHLSQDAQFASEKAAVNTTMAQNLVRPSQSACQLANANRLTQPLNSYTRSIRQSLQKELSEGYILNPNMTRQRAAINFVYILCKNGLLSPGNPGLNIRPTISQRWFTDNACVDFPAISHAFLEPWRILNKVTFVTPPRQANQYQDPVYVLDNPGDPNNTCTPEQFLLTGPATGACARLKDKELDWLVARRVCATFAISRIRPLEAGGDSSQTIRGMENLLLKISTGGRVVQSMEPCADAIARRTAPRTASADGSEEPSADMQEVKSRAKYIADFMIEAGADPRDFFQYPTYADRDADTNRQQDSGGEDIIYVSEYLKERFTAFQQCSALRTAKDINQAFGSDADVLNNQISCDLKWGNWDAKESVKDDSFAKMALGLSLIDTVEGRTNAPVKTNYDGSGGGRSLHQQDASWKDEKINMRELLAAQYLLQPSLPKPEKINLRVEDSSKKTNHPVASSRN